MQALNNIAQSLQPLCRPIVSRKLYRTVCCR